jgi:sugar lactone lactonase YvrE
MSGVPSRRVFVSAAALAGLVSLSAAVPIGAQATFQVVASGLDNPRGLAFGPEGALYIAEAGRGGDGRCITGPEGDDICYGATGAVTRVFPTNPATQTRILTGLPSLAPPPEAENAGEGALGPVDVGFLGRGNGYVTVGLGNNPAQREHLGPAGADFGRLLRFEPSGTYEFEEDLSGYEALANPDGGAIDSNPYGLLVAPSRRIVADAGANAINAVAANGAITTLAVFPNRLVQNPFAPPGVMIPMQAVPTTVVTGPDGDLYVGQLTGFPFPVGGANVYRVPAEGGTPEIAASGFTNIIDIAFGPDGSLYVLELFANGLLSNDPTGALIRVAPDGTKTTIASAGLTLPGGVAVGRDGALYVTTFATLPGAGQVIRINP